MGPCSLHPNRLSWILNILAPIFLCLLFITNIIDSMAFLVVDKDQMDWRKVLMDRGWQRYIYIVSPYVAIFFGALGYINIFYTQRGNRYLEVSFIILLPITITNIVFVSIGRASFLFKILLSLEVLSTLLMIPTTAWTWIINQACTSCHNGFSSCQHCRSWECWRSTCSG